jgi:hypothetical protein
MIGSEKNSPQRPLRVSGETLLTAGNEDREGDLVSFMDWGVKLFEGRDVTAIDQDDTAFLYG